MLRDGMLSRRAFFSVAIGAVACGSDSQPRADVEADGEAQLDEALSILHAFDPERTEAGLTNHGPMAAEALLALGQPGQIAPWVDGYIGDLRPYAADEMPLSPSEQATALAVNEAMPRWIATFEQLLLEGDPAVVFDDYFSTLSPGYAAAGFHGALRTAHILRALERKDTAVRRTELAHALGFWAATHRPLMGVPGSAPQAGRGIAETLEQVPMVPDDVTIPSGFIVDQMVAVDQVPEFATILDSVDLDALPLAAALDELVSAAARMRAAYGGIKYLHAFTGSSALRLMFPYLSDGNKRLGLANALQCVAAIHAIERQGVGVPAPPADPGIDPEAQAIEAGSFIDEHAIKLTEAGLREYARDPRPEFAAAAAS